METINLKTAVTERDHISGAPDAPVTLVEYGNFECVHCGQLFMHQQALEDHDLSRYARRIGLDGEKFAHDMSQNTFLEQIQIDYDRNVFDEHITGTPTFYINGVRYTGTTDVESLLLAIKQADTDGRLVLPEKTGLRGVLGRLHPGANK